MLNSVSAKSLFPFGGGKGWGERLGLTWPRGGTGHSALEQKPSLPLPL